MRGPRLASLAALLLASAAFGSPAEKLSLAEAVRLALREQPRLEVRAAEREEASARISAVDRLRLPSPVAELRHGLIAEPLVGPYYSLYRPYDRAQTLSTIPRVGLAGQLPWTGTRYTLSVEGLRQSSDRLEQPLSPTTQLVPGLEIRQPLLRGAFGTSYRAARESAVRALSAAEQALEAEAQGLVVEVVQKYWIAARAARSVEIRRAAQDHAAQTLKATEALLAGGRATADLVLAARAEVARRNQETVQAELAEVRGAAELTQLLHLEHGRAPRFELTEKPLALEALAAPPDAESLVSEALQTHPRLKARAAARDAAAAELALAERELLPDLSLTLRGGLTGVGGTSACSGGFLRDGISSCGVPPAIASGSLSGTFQTLASGQYHQWEAGLAFEAPWANPAVYQGVAAAKRRLAQAQAEVEHERHVLATEVRARLRELELMRQRAAAAQESLHLTQQALGALQQRFKLGGGTLFDLIRALDNLVLAEDAASSAAIDLTVAVARLDELRPGALLSRFDVKTKPEALP